MDLEGHEQKRGDSGLAWMVFILGVLLTMVLSAADHALFACAIFAVTIYATIRAMGSR